MVGATISGRPGRRSFGLILAITVAVIVLYGFSHTVGETFIHYRAPPPPILYVHVLAATAWLGLFILQTALVRSGDVGLHRRLGLWGLGLGSLVCLAGLATVIIMRRRDIVLHPNEAEAITFLSIPLFSLLSFAVPFILAAGWRKRPGLHRRLMILATCSLTGAALSRAPWLGAGAWVAAIVAALMLAATAEDWIHTGRPHPVYLIGVPAEIAGGQLAGFLAFYASPAWTSIAKVLLGMG